MIEAACCSGWCWTPVAANARAPVGLATPYASMLLEAREGEAAVVPVAAFRRGLNPTDADLQQYYAANRARYTVPEQRVIRIAMIGPEQVASVAASRAGDRRLLQRQPGDLRCEGYTRAEPGGRPRPGDRELALRRAPRRAGPSAAAAAPAGLTPVTTLHDQTREAYASIAGGQVAGRPSPRRPAPSSAPSVGFRLGRGEGRRDQARGRQDDRPGAVEIASKLTRRSASRRSRTGWLDSRRDRRRRNFTEAATRRSCR